MSYTSVTVEHIPGVTTFVCFKKGEASVDINALYKVGDRVQVVCDDLFPLPTTIKPSPRIEEIHMAQTCSLSPRNYLFCDSLSSVEDIKQLCLYFVTHQSDKEVADRLFSYAVAVAQAMREAYRPRITCLPEMPDVLIMTH